DPFGNEVSFVTADVTNTGSMTVLATALAQPFAGALAAGILIGNFTAGGSLIGISSFSGHISNTRTITAQGTPQTANSAFAGAAGIIVAASQFTGNISNAGGITAMAVATQLNIGLQTEDILVAASAAGIAALGETSQNVPFSGTTSFVGNVTNT